MGGAIKDSAPRMASASIGGPSPARIAACPSTRFSASPILPMAGRSGCGSMIAGLTATGASSIFPPPPLPRWACARTGPRASASRPSPSINDRVDEALTIRRYCIQPAGRRARLAPHLRPKPRAARGRMDVRGKIESPIAAVRPVGAFCRPGAVRYTAASVVSIARADGGPQGLAAGLTARAPS